MDSKVLQCITEQLSGLMEQYAFTGNAERDTFQNESLSFRIGYDETRKLLLLDIAEVTPEGVGNYSTASSWLFEDPENEQDAVSAGLDFLDTLKGKLGIRGVRTNRTGEVAMPRKDASGAKNMEMLCVKTLALFPKYKDAYKEHISTYGSLLYMEFFKETFAVRLGELLDENNKKSLKKIMAMLSEMYCEGDRAVQNVVVGVILGGAVRGNENRYNNAIAQLEEYSFLKTALQNIYPRVNSDKRFAEILAETK